MKKEKFKTLVIIVLCSWLIFREIRKTSTDLFITDVTLAFSISFLSAALMLLVVEILSKNKDS